jgi:hypothetical protein
MNSSVLLYLAAAAVILMSFLTQGALFPLAASGFAALAALTGALVLRLRRPVGQNQQTAPALYRREG